MAADPRPPELGALTSARFIAALVVVLSHYNMIVPVTSALTPVLTQGQAAVSFFFVLSGFILTYNYHQVFRDGIAPGAFGRYYRARFARIFPLHAVALVALTPLVLAAGLASSPSAWAAWLVDLCMLQGWLPFTEAIYGWNTPAWSISCEMSFYLALPFLLRFLAGRITGDRPALAWLAGLWLTGAVLGLELVLGLRHLLHALPDPAATEVVDIAYKFTPLARIWEFAVGCVAGLWHVRAQAVPESCPGYHAVLGRPWPRLAVLALGLAAAAAACYVPFLGGFKGYLLWLLDLYALFVPCFAAVILALAAGPTPVARLLDRPAARFLGEASYALYITHLLPYYVLKHDLVPGWRAHPVAWALAGIALTIVASGLLFRFVETPARRWLRSPPPVAPVQPVLAPE